MQSETHEINSKRVLTPSQSLLSKTHFNRRSHSLNTDTPQIHGYAQQNSTGVTIHHNSDFSWYSMRLSSIHTAQSMGLHGCCQVSAPLISTSRIRTETTLHSPRIQNRPKRCCLEVCREHHETARVTEDLLKVEGFSHKIVQIHQQGKTP